MTNRIMETAYLGRVAYDDGLRLQEERVEAVKRGDAHDALFLLEHDPVITLGRNAKSENIVTPPETLAEMGIQVADCGRGGDVTYHGPGQLVGYPILNLAPDRKDVGKYVRNLEEAIIRTLADYGIEGGRIKGLTGVWVGQEKVAAIGVRISRWVTSHGFALNIDPDLEHFRTIIPCGIRTHGVTSMRRLMDDPPALPEAAGRFAAHFGELFGRAPVWSADEAEAATTGGRERVQS